MNRRHFLLSAAAGALAPTHAFSRASAQAVLLLPLTGSAAPLGQMLHATALAAVDAVNRARLAGSRNVQLRVEDWRSDPARFDALVRQYGSGEGRPAAIFGPCPHQSREQVAAWLDSVDGVLWDPQPHSGGLNGFGIVPLGPTPYQSLSQSLPFLAREVGPRFLVVEGEGSYGRELARIGRWALGRMDSELVGVAGPDSRLGWLGRLRRERVDVVLCTLEGDELAEFLRAYAAARLDPAERPVLAPAMTELEVASIGPVVAAGHVGCQPYFAGWDTLGNQRFKAALRRHLPPGQLPTAQAEALWGLLHLFAVAVAVVGDLPLHPVLVREAARGRDVLLPQGRVTLEDETLQPRLWPKMGVATTEGGFRIIARSDRPLAALPSWGTSA